MEGIFFALGILALVLLVYWAATNDGREPSDGTIGLFAYRKSRIAAKQGPGPGRNMPGNMQDRMSGRKR